MAAASDDDDDDYDVSGGGGGGSSGQAAARRAIQPPPPAQQPPMKVARIVQQPRLNAFLPSAVHEANELERELEQERMATGDVTRCTICWEQQEHDDAFGDVA